MSLTLLILSTSLLASDPSAWPGFLGAGASAIDPSTIPLKWTAENNIVWQAKLPGKGQSSPVIWGNIAFATSIEGSMKDTCHVVAINLSDGKIIWNNSVDATQKVRSNYFQSRSAPTPVVDQDRVYAFFETGEVLAYSHAGKLEWQRSLVTDYGEFEGTIGLASSPVQTEDSVVILVDHEGPSYLIALDKKTGVTRWQTERTSRVSFASPAIVPIGATQQIVCSSSGTVDGYEPATGKLLWSHEGVGGNRSSTPLPYAPGRFLVGASPGMHNEREVEARKSNFAMQIEPNGETFIAKVAWGTEKAMPAFGSPLVYRGHAYWVNNVGVVYCFDAESGEQRYARRIRQVCWATPVGIGDNVYFFGKDGLTTVVATGPEFRIVAENPLWEGASSVEVKEDAGEHGHGGGAARGRPEAAGGRGAGPGNAAEAGGARGRGQTASGGGGPPTAGPGGLMFSDPVQYGVAVVNGSLLIRTGSVVYCVRNQP